MDPLLLIDFGSTYTKTTAVDVDGERIIGTAASFTTVETDITEGLENALSELRKQAGQVQFGKRLACSSAAGGLRMCASGLVPELTAQAARMASLGAGAKVIKTYAYELTEDDRDEIDVLRPDIFLLTGGTDGGNSDCILHNAEMLAQCKADFPILIAGNRSAARKCAELLAGREVHVVDNVMPKLDALNIEPAQNSIRDVFLNRIIRAKGLSKANELISDIMVPTPTAMLDAMTLLAQGDGKEAGIGDLMAVDLGGATTDVYSIAAGLPENTTTVMKGIPEPVVKRTVEGDIGMRYSAVSVLETVGAAKLAALAQLSEQQVQALIDQIAQNPETLPQTPESEQLDFALASAAVEVASVRHAGTIEEVFTPMGRVFAQTGKDLRTVKKLILTGGALIHSLRAAEIAKYAMASVAYPNSLRPLDANVLVDRNYILAAMGLLGKAYPNVALHIMKKELSFDGTEK